MAERQSVSARLFFSMGSALVVGYILVIGKKVIVPILVSVIAVSVLTRLVTWMRRRPVLRHFPSWSLHVFVLAFALIFLVLLGSIVAVTLEDMVDKAPSYQANLMSFVSAFVTMMGLENDPTWQDIRGVTLDQINLSALAGWFFSSLSSFGGTLFLIVIYVMFLMAEYSVLPIKVKLAFTHGEDAQRILETIGQISENVSQYLSAKTGINVVLGIVSLVFLWLFGVDFAAFWAICIALLNYIPYIGSAIAVALPVLTMIAQTGNLLQTIGLLAALMTAQIFVGNFLEPRLLGRQLNLAPVSIVLALSVWSAMWGIVGAIVAVPLTSVMLIIFRSFSGTRPLAVFLSGAAGEVDRRK